MRERALRKRSQSGAGSTAKGPRHPTRPSAGRGADAEFVRLQSATAGRYSIEREIGRGGMGIVYLARDVVLDRPVAIKMLRPELSADEQYRARFLDEARVAAKLSHPNVIPIFLVEEQGDLIFFVMGHVNGETLAEVVKRRGPLPIDEATSLLQQMAWALGYAHAHGVVHRDVKPENVLIERGTGRAIVTDFGIARVGRRSGETGVGEIIGSPHFMSPEQAAGERIDARSDIYSLGVNAFYMLTGRLPFDAPFDEQILAKHLTESPPSIGALRPGVPWALARIVERCLSKEPKNRFASGDLLAHDLTDIQERRSLAAPELREFEQIARTTGERLAILAPLGGILVYAIAALDHVAGTELLLLVWVGWIAFFELVRQPLRVFAAARRILQAGISYREVREMIQIGSYERLHRKDQPASDTMPRRLVSGAIAFAVATAALLALLIAPSWASSAAIHIRSIGVVGALFAVGFLGSVVLSVWGTAGGGVWIRQTVWGGRFGKWFFSLAGLGLSRPRDRRLPSPEAAEVVLGGQAAGIVRDLPTSKREQLAAVPEVLQQLERKASELRARRRELDRALMEVREIGAVPSAGKTRDQRSEPKATVMERKRSTKRELLAARDRVEEDLSNVLSQMEMIRLELIRLRAGTGSATELLEAVDTARSS